MENVYPREVIPYKASVGADVFQIPIEAFPGFFAWVYVVITPDFRALIDTGSGFGEANLQLEAGFRSISDLLGHPLSLSDLTHVLITHGHIDHFGGLAFLRARSSAQVGIHELDRRNISNYEERIAVSSRNLAVFFIEAGVPEAKRVNLMEMYRFHKSLYCSQPVDFTFEDIGMQLGPLKFLHVPGHCAGQVVIKCGDVLFSGDHVLAEISPHQAPERLTLYTGLSHYLDSLEKVDLWTADISLTLGGHRAPIRDLPTRIKEIETEHQERLALVLDLLAEPKTVAELSTIIFGVAKGYNELLALEETGAHVEYLYQRNHIAIENYRELEAGPGPVAVQFIKL